MQCHNNIAILNSYHQLVIHTVPPVSVLPPHRLVTPCTPLHAVCISGTTTTATSSTLHSYIYYAIDALRSNPNATSMHPCTHPPLRTTLNFTREYVAQIEPSITRTENTPSTLLSHVAIYCTHKATPQSLKPLLSLTLHDAGMSGSSRAAAVTAVNVTIATTMLTTTRAEKSSTRCDGVTEVPFESTIHDVVDVDGLALTSQDR